MSSLLKILAVVIALLVLLVVILKRSSVEIGLRATENNFTGQIANIAVSTWLVAILLIIEAVIVLLIFGIPKRLQ
jgi:hypothetical protein